MCLLVFIVQCIFVKYYIISCLVCIKLYFDCAKFIKIIDNKKT